MKTYKFLTKVALLVLAIPLFIFTSCDQPSELSSNEDLELKKGKLKIKAPSYEFTEWTGDLPAPCKQVCLVAGQHMNVGNVNVAVVDDGVLVTYEIIEPDIYINEIHLDIFLNEDAFKAAKKISGGGAIPGKFEYKLSWGTDEMISTHSVVIPNEYIESIAGVNDCFYIASHAALSNGETAWGGVCNASDKGVTLVDNVDTEDVEGALQFPGRNWSVYFKFCMDECDESPIDFTYAWEDLRYTGNDADYNDLVVKSDVIYTNEKLTINFEIVARGASYNHAFKIKIPSAGVGTISGETSVTEDANSKYITIFNSSKDQLEAYGIHGVDDFYWTSNTAPDDTDCDPIGLAQLIINITDSEAFGFNPDMPYEPFITVFPHNEEPYDLYIFEVSGRDTWTTENGDELPNGILIPIDWSWPTEATKIWHAYPLFPDDNWTESSVAGLVWSCTP